MTVRIIGVGMGPQHLTAEAVEALRASSYVLAADKCDDDPLLAVRRMICEPFGLSVVAVADPPRDRRLDDYDRAVEDWHAARAGAWAAAMTERDGDPAILAWGDPSLYDSTIRLVSTLGMDYEVVAGVSAPQLLAARHRMVLHDVGRPVLITTERRLGEALADGAENVVVMLTSRAPSVEWLVSRLASLAPQPPGGFGSLAPQPPGGFGSLVSEPPGGFGSDSGSVVEVRRAQRGASKPPEGLDTLAGARYSTSELSAARYPTSQRVQRHPAQAQIWWGANLGTASERLVAGPLADVEDEIAAARTAAKDEAGWVMDLYRLSW